MSTRGERRARGSAIALWILAVVAALFFLRAAASLLIPIVIAVLISYALEPVVSWMVSQRVPRTLAASAVLLVMAGAAGWGMYSLRDDVRHLVESLPGIARRAREIVLSQTGSGTGARLQQAAAELQGGGAQAQASPGTGGGAGSQPASGEALGSKASGSGSESAAPPGESGGPVPDLAELLQRGVSSLLTLAGHLLVIFFLVFFLLLSGQHVKNRLVEISGPDAESRRRTARIVDDINAQVERFLLVRLVTAVIVGAATWAVLAWMGVQNAAVWGILAGVFNSIPYFGPVIVSGGLLAVGVAQGGGLTQALHMSGAALVITSIEGWLLTPPLMGKAERMSALAVFVGLLLWTWVWGAWGTILAVPMLVVLKSVADHVESLNPVGRLLAP
ncbi:MAG TPA: AI-2E family transporter [Vicinamibacterales bacterium]|nr:AI-2E family transporter [Vicinamibacterales bacterium]